MMRKYGAEQGVAENEYENKDVSKKLLRLVHTRQTQSVRSKVRYWIASLTCSGVIESEAARSATVRETFRMRS